MIDKFIKVIPAASCAFLGALVFTAQVNAGVVTGQEELIVTISVFMIVVGLSYLNDMKTVLEHE